MIAFFLSLSVALTALSHAIEPALCSERAYVIDKKKKKPPKPVPQPQPPAPQKPRESPLAHRLLDGLRGLEIGGASHNPFGLNTLNIDYEDKREQALKKGDSVYAETLMKVDIVAQGDHLPFVDNFWDFVISSHVIEHFYDPVKAILEWIRVVKPGGYVFMIVPHKDRTFDKDRERTTLQELIDRHENPHPPVPMHYDHHSFWITEDFIELCHYYGWPIIEIQDVDDKVGNGFTIVIQKPL